MEAYHYEAINASLLVQMYAIDLLFYELAHKKLSKTIENLRNQRLPFEI